MPKVKASKSRIHLKAASAKSKDSVETPAQDSQQAVSAASLKHSLGIEVDFEERESKKDKRKHRHDRWMSKLEATYNPQKKKKKGNAQDQSLSVDFGSFHQALSVIDPKASTTARQQTAAGSIASAASSAASNREANKAQQQQYTIHADSSKPLQSKKSKKNAAMKEILRFQNVLAHPAFKSNPLQTIQQHVKNTMEMVAPETSAASAMES
ncbi:hypothetical protein DFQ27_004373 [Actinomortierella ambigua]|uniref:Ribosome biogenesis protein SLX9 n=1 Tax=Actinomortierella ambigua TaxID=1343610 RepID=A0A9P6U4J7_9FUNG|nr:hypothetical protein DFQ26_001929 [Actinomortierella ambigua]KAG0258943.1 hypothetical protein DFQ27_004373 [Actinomortierella ambigua]